MATPGAEFKIILRIGDFRYRLGRGVPLRRLFSAYGRLAGVSWRELRFYAYGIPAHPDYTPRMPRLWSGDFITVIDP